MQPGEILVTTGGTYEPIDDVRGITNFSTGRFADAIAQHLAQQVCEQYPSAVGVIHELVARHVLKNLPSTPPLDTAAQAELSNWLGTEAVALSPIQRITFTSAADLQDKMLSYQQPRIVLHAAAVSDYTVAPTEGKISSTQDELTLKLTKTPKILAQLRQAYGRESFLVGFKLLSGVSQSELLAAARCQLVENHLNLVVANDLAKLHDGQHPVLVVTPEGYCSEVAGQREEVASQLAAYILRRANTTWWHSEPSELHGQQPLDTTRQLFANTLDLAHEMHLLTDTAGNVTAHDRRDYLLASPRGVDKQAMTADDAVYAHINQLPRRPHGTTK